MALGRASLPPSGSGNGQAYVTLMRSSLEAGGKAGELTACAGNSTGIVLGLPAQCEDGTLRSPLSGRGGRHVGDSTTPPAITYDASHMHLQTLKCFQTLANRYCDQIRCIACPTFGPGVILPAHTATSQQTCSAVGWEMYKHSLLSVSDLLLLLERRQCSLCTSAGCAAVCMQCALLEESKRGNH